MSGEYLKDFLRRHNVSQSEIARRLGLSQSSFNQMLSSNDVKSSLVERIASVFHMSIGEIYNDGREQKVIATCNGIAVAGNNNVAGNITTNDTALLQERVMLLQRILEEKERLIQVLMKQIK